MPAGRAACTFQRIRDRLHARRCGTVVLPASQPPRRRTEAPARHFQRGPLSACYCCLACSDVGAPDLEAGTFSRYRVAGDDHCLSRVEDASHEVNGG